MADNRRIFSEEEAYNYLLKRLVDLFQRAEVDQNFIDKTIYKLSASKSLAGLIWPIEDNLAVEMQKKPNLIAALNENPMSNEITCIYLCVLKESLKLGKENIVMREGNIPWANSFNDVQMNKYLLQYEDLKKEQKQAKTSTPQTAQTAQTAQPSWKHVDFKTKQAAQTPQTPQTPQTYSWKYEDLKKQQAPTSTLQTAQTAQTPEFPGVKPQDKLSLLQIMMDIVGKKEANTLDEKHVHRFWTTKTKMGKMPDTIKVIQGIVNEFSQSKDLDASYSKLMKEVGKSVFKNKTRDDKVKQLYEAIYRHKDDPDYAREILKGIESEVKQSVEEAKENYRAGLKTLGIGLSDTTSSDIRISASSDDKKTEEDKPTSPRPGGSDRTE